jgi:hypothetical protein
MLQGSSCKTDSGLENIRLCRGSTAITLRPGRSGLRIPVGARDFSFLQKSILTLGPTQPPIEWAPRFWGWGVKLITHIPLASRVRMSGPIPLIPLYAFMTRTGTILLQQQPVIRQYTETVQSSPLSHIIFI